jgi:DNA-binding transcriptional LysR family regulator
MKETILSLLPATFVAVAERRSITRAAEDMGLAKSAVSRNIKKLESQLGVKLAIRSTRQFSLTPAGERYFHHCRGILALSHRASSEMESFGASPSSSLKITAPHAMIESIISPAVSKLVGIYPRLEPNILVDDKRLDIVGNGIDVAITVGILKDSNLKARKVGTMENVLCLSKKLISDITNGNANYFISEVQNLPYLAHERENSNLVSYKLKKFNGESEVNVQFKPTLTVNTINALLSFCREGLGVALLPDFAIKEDLASGDLVRFLPEYSLGKSPVYAVHPYDSFVPKNILTFVELVKNEFVNK